MHLFQLIQQPLCQAALFLLLTVIIVLIARPSVADKLWVIAGTLYFLFILSNAILLFYAGNAWYYFFISLGASILYIVAAGSIANILIKILRLEGTEESAMIFLIILIHPLALLLVVFLKWVFLNLF